MWQVVGDAQFCVYLCNKNVREREEKTKRSKNKIGKEEKRDIPDVVRALLELCRSRTTSVIAGDAPRSGGDGRSGGRSGGGGGGRGRGRGRGGSHGRTGGGTGSNTSNVVSVLAAHVRTGAGLSRLLKDNILTKD